MQDWNLWLNSSETRHLVKILKEEAEELKDHITNGSHLQEKGMEKIALDFTYSSGFLDGIQKALLIVREIKDYVEEENGNQ